MTYISLGSSGLKVSRLWLGAMMFGLRTGEAEAETMIAHARANGINALDTADAYAAGASEAVLGRLIQPDRARWVVATKAGARMGDDPNQAGMSRRWLMLAADQSLKRLGTGWIDLYYLHLDDNATPLEETVRAMGDLIQAGKIRYFGLSNFRAWRMARVVELCRAMGVPQPIAIQPPYSAVTRGIETEIIPCAASYGLGVVSYSPLARGVLTGKYASAAAPDPASRAGLGDKRMLETEFRQESLDIAQKIKKHVEASGRGMVDFAIQWVLANRLVSGVIAGPRTPEQWIGYVNALQSSYGQADEAFIDQLVRPGHASTPGYTDPAYPVLGRAPQFR